MIKSLPQGMPLRFSSTCPPGKLHQICTCPGSWLTCPSLLNHVSRPEIELACRASSRQSLLARRDIQLALGDRATINVTPCPSPICNVFIWSWSIFCICAKSCLVFQIAPAAESVTNDADARQWTSRSHFISPASYRSFHIGILPIPR